MKKMRWKLEVRKSMKDRDKIKDGEMIVKEMRKRNTGEAWKNWKVR